MCCERAERIEAGKQRRRQAPACCVEPERRGSAQDADAVPAPDRRMVLDAFRVVPHAVGVDDVAAARPDDVEHQAVDVIRHARDHVPRRLAQALRPMAPHQLVIAADAARRDDDRLRAQRERSSEAPRARLPAFRIVGFEHVALHAVDRAGGPGERRDAMAEAERDEPALLGRAHAAQERREHARPGAPGDVEARHRVAVAGRKITAALGPADHGEDLQALLIQPRTLFAGREVDIGLGPAARPKILVAVEAGRAEPVLPGKIAAVADAHAALLRRVDEEQSAERPERLPAERGLAFLIEDDHPPACIRKLGRGHEAREPRADHDGVRVHVVPQRWRRMLSVWRDGRQLGNASVRVRTCWRACRTSFAFKALPRPHTVLAMVTPTPAAIMAYSIAVAPRSSSMKRRRIARPVICAFAPVARPRRSEQRREVRHQRHVRGRHRDSPAAGSAAPRRASDLPSR